MGKRNSEAVKLNEAQKAKVVNALSAYREYERYISSQEYAKEHFDRYGKVAVKDKSECLEKMKAIEDLIGDTLPSREGCILHLRYITGLSVDRCAEAMQISRRTAFRVLDKAHVMAFCLMMINQNTIK